MDGVMGCAGCSAAWKMPRAVVVERGEWECLDDRNRAAKLFRPGISRVKMDEGLRAQFKSIRRSALGGSGWTAYVSGWGFAAIAVFYLIEGVEKMVNQQYWFGALWCVFSLMMALNGVYAAPPTVEPLWYRRGIEDAVDEHERPAGWGTYDV